MPTKTPPKKKRCKYCRKWFTPNPRTAVRQYCCTRRECQTKRKSDGDKTWRAENEGYEQSRNSKKRAWAARHNYNKKWRKNHADYRARDNKRRRIAHQKVKTAARQELIRQTSVERLNSIPKTAVTIAARQELISRRVDVVIDYIFNNTFAARRIPTDLIPRSGP